MVNIYGMKSATKLAILHDVSLPAAPALASVAASSAAIFSMLSYRASHRMVRFHSLLSY